MLQFIQFHLERALRPLDLGRLWKIERQNDRRFFFRERFPDAILVTVPKQDRFHFEFIRDPQGAQQIKFVFCFKYCRVPLHLLGERGQTRVRFRPLRRRRTFPIRVLRGLVPLRVEKTLPDQRDAAHQRIRITAVAVPAVAIEIKTDVLRHERRDDHRVHVRFLKIDKRARSVENTARRHDQRAAESQIA